MIHVLFALLLLVVPLQPGGGFSEALLLARIAVAEAGGRWIWGSEEAAAEAQVAVMWVVRNRMDDRRWPDTVQGVAYAFSTGQRPTWPGMGPHMAALSILRLPAETSPHPYLYVLSQQDVQRLGLPEGEMVLRANEIFALHFYEEWPK